MPRKRNNVVALAGLVLLALFLAGLTVLFQMRFSAGDIYPPYSSKRADPLGCKALFEGLNGLENISAERHYRRIDKLRNSGDATLYWLGELPWGEPGPAIRKFAESGGRLILAMVPRKVILPKGKPTATAGATPAPPLKSPPPVPSGPDPTMDEDESPILRRMVRPNVEKSPWADSWRCSVDLTRLPGDESLAEPVPGSGFDSPMRWHGWAGLTDLSEKWRVLFRVGDVPVVAERRFGRGSIVVMTDSWPLSNEALRDDRNTAFLLWLADGRPRQVFDEWHLGVSRNPGVASLLSRYRLYWVVGACLALACLFVWRNWNPLIPPPPAAATGDDAVTGRDAAAGFVNLLRRGIEPSRLIRECFEEWKTSQSAATSRDRLARMESIVNDADFGGRRNPVDVYRDLHRAWKRPDVPAGNPGLPHTPRQTPAASGTNL